MGYCDQDTQHTEAKQERVQSQLDVYVTRMMWSICGGTI